MRDSVGVVLGTKEKMVMAVVGNGEDVLIGVELLRDSDVFISFPKHKVSVIPTIL